MKKPSCLLIVALVLLLLIPVPVFAESDSTGPATSVSDSYRSALSVVPAATIAPIHTLVKNPYAVVTTTITPQAGSVLMLDSVPAGASVYVDGTLKGTTPLRVSPITPGVHAVSFRMAGYVDYTTKVTVTAGAVAKEVATMVPVTQGTVTRTVTPSVSGTILVPVTTGVVTEISSGITVQVPVTRGTETTTLPVTSVPLQVTQKTQQITPEQTGICTRHFFGSGEMNTASDGRLNCTTLISTDDGITTLNIPKGTIVTDAGKKPVPEIRITPVTPADIPRDAIPDGIRWTGRAYHYLPDHTSFDPPVLVAFTLSQEEWDRSDPANLTIMETNENGPGWERLPTTIDAATRTISAPARHFSIIGLFSTNPAENPPVTQQSPLDLIRTATESNNAPLPTSPVIPDVYAPLAAVVAGVVVSVIGTTAGGSAAVSWIWDKITQLLEKFFGSEITGLMNSSEIEKRGIHPSENLSAIVLGLSSREILVIGISACIFAAAFILQNQLDLDLVPVVIFVFVGGITTILHDLAHKYGAYRYGCITEYKVWGLGTVTMLSTAWLFGNAFAKPSRTLIRSEKNLLPEEAAFIKLAGPLMSMGVAIVSLFLIPLGGLFAILGSAGFSMNLLNSVFSLVPVKPNDGVEIYAWNKLIWAVVFIPLIAFYLYIYLPM
ncbi:MAG: PEGA domain-containing protein [Methanoregula sp.]|nr:PEGA domain-containing protein [Methanoregula sp.]